MHASIAIQKQALWCIWIPFHVALLQCTESVAVAVAMVCRCSSYNIQKHNLLPLLEVVIFFLRSVRTVAADKRAPSPMAMAKQYVCQCHTYLTENKRWDESPTETGAITHANAVVDRFAEHFYSHLDPNRFITAQFVSHKCRNINLCASIYVVPLATAAYGKAMSPSHLLNGWRERKVGGSIRWQTHCNV